MTASATTDLAIHGGPKAVASDPGDLFAWPIVSERDEAAVLDVLRRGAMSATDVTRAFEGDLAEWFGTEHALCSSNGTQAIRTPCGLAACAPATRSSARA